MALTPEQEAYLAAFADRGLADDAAAAARQKAIDDAAAEAAAVAEVAGVVSAAKPETIEALQAQVQALVNASGLKATVTVTAAL